MNRTFKTEFLTVTTPIKMGDRVKWDFEAKTVSITDEPSNDNAPIMTGLSDGQSVGSKNGVCVSTSKMDVGDSALVTLWAGVRHVQLAFHADGSSDDFSTDPGHFRAIQFLHVIGKSKLEIMMQYPDCTDTDVNAAIVTINE